MECQEICGKSLSFYIKREGFSRKAFTFDVKTYSPINQIFLSLVSQATAGKKGPPGQRLGGPFFPAYLS